MRSSLTLRAQACAESPAVQNCECGNTQNQIYLLFCETWAFAGYAYIELLRNGILRRMFQSQCNEVNRMLAKMSRRRFILRLFFAQCCQEVQVMWGEMGGCLQQVWELVKGRATQVTLGVTNDVKMDIRERIVVNYLDGNSLCQDSGQQQAVANEILFLKDCCVALYVEPASNIRSILLCPERFVLSASL